MVNPHSQGIVRRKREQYSLGQVSRLALLCSAAVVFPGMAMAQTTDQTTSQPDTSSTANQPAPGASQPAPDSGQIIITGIRASIAKSLAVKRNSDAIVDVISAEDIGKLPDQNIAEAVQRIPGVSIDREGGEGRHISINGLGPQFSLTLLNGRQIASSDADRSFSFDTLASSIVSQVVVYKTINADNPEGGLGGTIDIRTARPFDFPGFKAVIDGSYQYDSNSKTGYPQISAMLSDRFMDGRLGVLFSFNHQKRKNLHNQVGTGAWGTNYFIDPVGHYYVEDALNFDQNGNFVPDAWRPWNVHFEDDVSERTRDTGTAVLQFKATDNLTLTADYLYSKYTVKDTTKYGGAYLWAFVCAQKDANGNCIQGTPGTVIDSSNYYTTLDMAGPVNGVPTNTGSFLWQYTSFERPTTTQLGGLNAEWKPSTKFKGVFDGYWSSAINNDRGLDTLENLEMGGEPEYTLTMPATGLPVLNTLGNNLADPTNIANHLAISQVYNSGTYVKAINKGASGDFDWSPFSRTHVKFGASYTDERKSDIGYATPSPVDQLYHATGLGQPFPTSLINGATIIDGFPVFNIDPTALRAWMADPTNLALRPASGQVCDSSGNCITKAQSLTNAFLANGGFTAQRTASSFTVDEKDIDAYGQIVQNFTLGSVDGTVVAGARYSRTNLTSSGTSRLITGYSLNAQNQNNLVAIYQDNGAQTPVSVKHSYGYFLPSLNAKFDLTPDFIFRVALTKTMTRPDLGDLAPAISCCGGTVLRRTGSGTNPDLTPYTSKNVDLSAEWYYSKRGAFTLAGFYKDAKGFIVYLTEPEQITTVTDVSQVVAVHPTLTLADLQTAYITRPHNAASATVKGVTAAWTQSLRMGLGFQANYTKVWSKTKTGDPNATPFELPGVSDTANAILFYEKGIISARVAYNWRSAFLVSPEDSFDRAVYGDAHYQIDARIGVNLPHDLSFGVSVVNLTNSKDRYYSQKPQYFEQLDNYGRQITFDISKKF